MRNFMLDVLGVVVIGRNEEKRLEGALKSVLSVFDQDKPRIIYVDSGSTDLSVSIASSLNVKAHKLDDTVAFTPARGRNKGAELLLAEYPQIKYIQFLDGDCVLNDHWFPIALRYIQERIELAIVCGYCTELNPNESVYNALCSLEWARDLGDLSEVGGNFLCKVDAFNQVSGFNSQMRGGEEPDLCRKLKSHDWKIERIAYDMVSHDANIQKFSEWNWRVQRSGEAMLHGALLARASKTNPYARQLLSVLFWAFILPSLIVVATIFDSASLLLTLLYPAKTLQIFFRLRSKIGAKLALVSASNMVFGKFLQFWAIIKFLLSGLLPAKKHNS